MEAKNPSDEKVWQPSKLEREALADLFRRSFVDEKRTFAASVSLLHKTRNGLASGERTVPQSLLDVLLGRTKR
jgi:hypothetical protein